MCTKKKYRFPIALVLDSSEMTRIRIDFYIFSVLSNRHRYLPCQHISIMRSILVPGRF